MLIKTSELKKIFTDVLPRATPLEAKHLNTQISGIEKESITASLDSPLSQGLRKIVNDNKSLFTKEAFSLLEETDIYGVAFGSCNSVARVEKKRKQIIIFEGILNLIKLYTDFIKAADVLKNKRGDKKILVDGVLENERDIFSQAVFIIAMDYIKTGEGFVDIGDILPDKERMESESGVMASKIFLLLHELAHLKLGHNKLGGETYFEFNSQELLIKEELNKLQQRELEADRFAFSSINKDIRDMFLSSIICFLGAFSFTETFFGGNNHTHPLAINRMERIANLISFSNDPELEEAKREIIESEKKRFIGLSDLREKYTEDKIGNFNEVMTVNKAHSIISVILHQNWH